MWTTLQKEDKEAEVNFRSRIVTGAKLDGEKAPSSESLDPRSSLYVHYPRPGVTQYQNLSHELNPLPP